MVVKMLMLSFTVLLFSFMMKKNNVLSILLTLETMVLMMFLLLCMSSELFFSVIFLSVGACEAAVGLGCLVGLIRLWGQSSIRLMECDYSMYSKAYYS